MGSTQQQGFNRSEATAWWPQGLDHWIAQVQSDIIGHQNDCMIALQENRGFGGGARASAADT